MNAFPILIATGLLATAVGGLAVAADQPDDRMTICHIPPGNPGAARTEEIPRSAWSAHQGHGDHQGACTDADRRAAPAPSQAPAQPLPQTKLALSAESDGDIDGDATFKVLVANKGNAAGVGVQVVVTLRGDGAWRMHPTLDVSCAVAGDTVTCDYADIPVDAKVPVRVSFDGDLSVCREVSLEARMTADNDASPGDDRSRTSAWVGACAPLDPPGMAIA
jgi:hypothetical protein